MDSLLEVYFQHFNLLPYQHLELVAYVDTDLASDQKEDLLLITCFLNGGAISWMSRLLSVMALSATQHVKKVSG